MTPGLRLFVVTVVLLCGEASATVADAPPDPGLALARTALDEGLARHNEGRFVDAEASFEQALALREAVHGPRHPELVECLSALGAALSEQGAYDRAEAMHQRALAIQEQTLGDGHPDVALSLINLAGLHQNQGQYAQAASLYERAFTKLKAALDRNDPELGTALYLLSMLYLERGDIENAKPLFERALARDEALHGDNPSGVVNALYNLAGLYQQSGVHARAKVLYERVLAIEEANHGQSHPRVATALESLADLHQARGEYARAEALYERALAIRRSVFGEAHPYVANTLFLLGNLHFFQENYSRAGWLYEQSLAIREAALGEHHLHVAYALTRLALNEENDARAKSLHERSLAIQEAVLGPYHPDVAVALNFLANFHRRRGDFARAAPLYERVLAMEEAAFGEHHPDVAIVLNNLAGLHAAQGDATRAEPLYERALAIEASLFGESDPRLSGSLRRVARFQLDRGQYAKAFPLLSRAFSSTEAHLRQEVAGFSEARLSEALGLLREGEELLYSLVRASPGNARVRLLALASVLLRKDRSVEELAQTSRIIHRELGEVERGLLASLRATRTRFAALSFTPPEALEPGAHPRQLQALSKQCGTLETELARRSEPLRAHQALPPPAEIIDRVAAALPPASALVEFVAYHDRPLVQRDRDPYVWSRGEPRYLAFVLFGDGRTHALDLGPAERVDRAAWRLHDALANASAAYQPLAEDLYALAFQPLVPVLGDVRRLFVSPDSALSVVPFAALHDGSRFLVDTFDITYLTSGKQLLRRPQDSPPACSVVALADPDFDGAPASAPRADFASWVWPPLPGTRSEAEAIQRLFPHARLLLGREATKAALFELASPGVLHLATHGFFLEEAPAPAHTRAVQQFGDFSVSEPRRRPAHPLLRSGLVLAGANAPEAEAGTGAWVTALELAGLDLWGTQLVVLSACDTGRGDVKPGQGVQGLRRALVAAGAETVVASLWKVNDDSTRELMEGYYTHLATGGGRTGALREAMRAFRHKRPHPHDWAPFIALGQDGPLRGLVSCTEPRESMPSRTRLPPRGGGGAVHPQGKTLP